MASLKVKQSLSEGILRVIQQSMRNLYGFNVCCGWLVSCFTSSITQENEIYINVFELNSNFTRSISDKQQMFVLKHDG